MTTISKELELWAGFECTINRVKEQWFDQSARSGHAERLQDLDLVAGLGVRKVRYPVLWETAQRDDGAFDFTWAAQRLQRLQELRIEPIAGLLHHGSGPRNTSLVDPAFPDKLAHYARAVAERFPHLQDYTPVNEPLTTARFSGLYGVWYPHGKDNRTFLTALLNECRGTVLAMREIRAVNPAARLVQTDDLGRASATGPCRAQARFENERRWLTYDLLFGRVDANHPLWSWLLENGVEQLELEWFLENTCPPDVVGINHYPLSNRFIDHRLELYPDQFHCFRESVPYADLGVPQARSYLGDDRHCPPIILPEDILREVCARYDCPVAVTEVHIDGPRESQVQWLNEVWRAAQRVRSEGGNVCAVTVWSLLGSFDWNSLCALCRSYYEPGVFDVRSDVPRPTAIARVARALATEGQCDEPLAQAPGWWRPAERARASTPPLVIIGAGRLGKAFARVAHQRGLEYRLLRRAEVDIASIEQVRAALGTTQPWAVVNAAGLARVNQAEANPGQAFRDNADGCEILAAECAAVGVPMVAFSSHLVFDGSKAAPEMIPYVEHDDPRPLNVYGRTKAEMEARVLGTHAKALVVRTGSFLSPWDRHDFIARSLQRIRAGHAVSAADDELISPAYLPDLVNACLDLLVDGMFGLVHLANQGATSRAQLVRAAAQSFAVSPSLIRARHQLAGPAHARRPCFSVLSSVRARNVMPPLDEALERCFRELAHQGLVA